MMSLADGRVTVVSSRRLPVAQRRSSVLIPTAKQGVAGRSGDHPEAQWQRVAGIARGSGPLSVACAAPGAWNIRNRSARCASSASPLRRVSADRGQGVRDPADPRAGRRGPARCHRARRAPLPIPTAGDVPIVSTPIATSDVGMTGGTQTVRGYMQRLAALFLSCDGLNRGLRSP